MKSVIITLVLLGGFTALSTTESSAVVCAAGVYRAGCVGVRGAAVVHRCRHAACGRDPALKIVEPQGVDPAWTTLGSNPERFFLRPRPVLNRTCSAHG